MRCRERGTVMHTFVDVVNPTRDVLQENMFTARLLAAILRVVPIRISNLEGKRGQNQDYELSKPNDTKRSFETRYLRNV